ncbi:MAG: ferritin family protein [Rhodospirillaceae bacterium]|nr:ferritin family protein [Rhodospirillaceae bacterium]MCA8932162.1 ferritin family protein [Rhodospirillaceae bacterium]
MAGSQNSAAQPVPPIESVAELLCQAHAMEEEAANRYRDLAESLEGVNAKLAEVFRRMAVIEAKHVARVDELAEGLELPGFETMTVAGWQPGEGPETLDRSKVDPDSTQAQALAAMLELEETAVAYFTRIAETTSDSEVQRLAGEMAEEERQHVALLNGWLAEVGGAPAP